MNVLCKRNLDVHKQKIYVVDDENKYKVCTESMHSELYCLLLWKEFNSWDVLTFILVDLFIFSFSSFKQSLICLKMDRQQIRHTQLEGELWLSGYLRSCINGKRGELRPLDSSMSSSPTPCSTMQPCLCHDSYLGTIMEWEIAAFCLCDNLLHGKE